MEPGSLLSRKSSCHTRTLTSVGRPSPIFRALGARPRVGPEGSNRKASRLCALGPLDSEQHARPGAEFLAEEKKWENGFRSGQVRNVTAKDAANLVKNGWVLLDVRPPTEIAKARVIGAVEVPIFVPDTANDLGALLRQMSAFGMGGWWLGGTHTVPNPNFLQEVQAKVPRSARLIVSCQKGLRSLAACEQLSRAGYQQVAWINGGFDSFKPGEVETEGGVDVRCGGIGGVSEVLGWTEVQQASKDNKSLGSFEGVLKVAAVLLLVDGVLFVAEQLNYSLSSATMGM